MATGSMPRFATAPFDAAGRRRERAAAGLPWRLLQAAGSLKVTVVMFVAATFLLFVGTLAQDEKNMPEVKAEYFNSWVAWVPWSDFFPVTVFGPSTLRWGFPFPGGATIGLVLLANLIAAKATRFHVAKASPARLAWGTVVTLLGAVIVGFVLLSGHQGEGLQGRPPIGYDAIWRCVQAGALLSCCGLAAAAWATRRGPLVRAALAAAAAGLGILAALAVGGGDDWRMGEPGLRIMWQLIQSSLAALVLLVGLVLVFGQRGGNVLIHLAVGLLMVGQFAFGDRQLEQRISLLEGRTTNMVFRSDETELAVRERRGTEDHVTAVAARLLAARAGGAPIDVDGLPFTITVVRWFGNSTIVPAGPRGENPATSGLGTRWLALPRPPEGGSSSRTNIASAYVRLAERGSGRDLGTYLVTQYVNDQSQILMGGSGDECDEVEAGGGRWLLQLRFRRDYKPYTVRLDDVQRVNYSTSETPRDYSSHVTFTDRASGAEQKARIWMNNPVRYRGETFYQSQYLPADPAAGRSTEMTGLQVVENAGWLIPYVACVLAFWGMLVHFGITFVRFADRRARDGDAGPAGRVVRPVAGPRRLLADALMVVLPVAVCALPTALPRRAAPDAADWPAAATLAVMHEGRLKPLDTVACNLLQLLGNRTVVRMPEEGGDLPADAPRGRVPAARWLLGVMAGAEWTEHAPVFRIDAAEVVDLFELTRRPGHRYCAAELEAGRPALRRQIEALADVPPEQRSFAQKKMLEINQKLQAYDLVRLAYETPALAKPEGDGEEARRAFAAQIQRVLQAAQMVDEGHPPALVPPAGAGAKSDDAGRWQALYPALVAAIRAKAAAGTGPFRINPAIIPLSELLAAVDAPPADFNRALAGYRTAVERVPEVRAGAGRVAYEAWLNTFNPTELAKWLYVLAVVLCFTSFLAWHAPLNRFVSCMLLGVLVLHTFALASRIWLTGRPPVVNLYSSAVFIGWACVLAGLVLEWMHRMGIGNLVAALAGALTLMVAYGLDTGDTMHVLQAVLDTQFWLSTHVITVTLGYGATFLAGLLGTCAIVHRVWTRNATAAAAEAVQDRLYRMTYGVVCFALFFSFIGTVLGGLWADDSWGRFWGWDPKENGALMIVLWNAAALHARWDRWIGPRGFALFAIGGNIITAWSWFGTNQLGIGLHSYGFTSGVLLLLGGYVLSQLVLIAVGLLLTSSRRPVTA